MTRGDKIRMSAKWTEYVGESTPAPLRRRLVFRSSISLPRLCPPAPSQGSLRAPRPHQSRTMSANSRVTPPANFTGVAADEETK